MVSRVPASLPLRAAHLPVNLDRRKVRDLVDWAKEVFELGDAWGERIQRELAYGVSDVGGSVRRSDSSQREHGDRISDIAEALLGDVSCDRVDRLWPGDPAQFSESSVALAHGAGGVLLALNAAGFAPSRGTVRLVRGCYRSAPG